MTEGGFGPEHVNVASQRDDPESLLAFIGLLIERYRESPELGWADFSVLDQPHRHVLGHECAWDDRRIVAVHNLSPESCSVPLTLDDCDSSVYLLGGRAGGLRLPLAAADAPRQPTARLRPERGR
jgi:glycosidase